MRHMAKKKRKPLLSFTKNKLLHSKSTYFYKQWFLKLKAQIYNSVNGFGVSLSSSRFKLDSTVSARVNRTRLSQRVMNPYGGITKFGSTYLLPCVCVLALLLVLGCMVSPVTSGGEEVYAAYEPVTSTSGVSLLMETNDALAQETNASNGVTAYRYNRFKMNKGSDIDKYQVLVQAANGYDSNLVGAENGQVVNAVSGTVKGNAIDSAWGYSLAEGAITSEATLANLDYQALPGSGSTNTSATPYTETKEFTLAFAANIKDKPADHYQTNVLLSVAAGAYQIATELGFNGITEMQQMTSSVCNSAPTGLEGRLKDTRDNKVYWVAKLKDNNCWMTQNLDLDLSASKALTSADSDVSSDWTPGYSTQDTPWTGTSVTQRSYDPGSYYYTTPTTSNSCTSPSGLKGCTSKGWKLNATNAEIEGLADVSTWTATYDLYFVVSESFVGLDGQSVCNKTAGSIFGDKKYTQCHVYYDSGNVDKIYEHYHAGNYYAFGAATAGTAPSNNGVASSSICPRGWKLPSGGDSAGDFYTIFDGMTGDEIIADPYYFVLAGHTYDGKIDSAGGIGTYTSSMRAGVELRGLYFSSDSSAVGYRNIIVSYATPIRCIAK